MAPPCSACDRTAVGALTHADRGVVRQLAVLDMGSEIPALKDLLGPMDLTQTVVTADALPVSSDNATFLIARGADCVMTVKAERCVAEHRL